MSSIVTHTFDDRARALCPGLRIDGVLHRTDKAALLVGVLDGVDVVAKILTDTEAFWQAKFTAEVATYQAFKTAPPPVPAPRLLDADPDAGVLVVTRLPGAPVATGRYPTRLSIAGAAPLLQAARSLQQWMTPNGLFGPVWDYPQRFRRYRCEYGLLDARDEAALNVLVKAAGPLRMAHGDLLPANVLQHTGTVSGVLDWEFTGRFLPGLDAALLWITLGHLPAARHEAEQLAGTSVAEQIGFWANVATVCLRELRTHGELPAGPLRAARLLYLQDTWSTVQARVHELAGDL